MAQFSNETKIKSKTKESELLRSNQERDREREQRATRVMEEHVNYERKRHFCIFHCHAVMYRNAVCTDHHRSWKIFGNFPKIWRRQNGDTHCAHDI